MSMSERLSGGDLWDRETEPKKLQRLQYVRSNPGASGPRWARDPKGNLLKNEHGRPYVDPNWDGNNDYTERYDLSDRSGATPPAEVVEEYAKENGRRYAEAHAAEMRDRQARAMAMRLAQLQREGAKFGIDLAPKIAVFIRDAQREVATARRKAA